MKTIKKSINLTFKQNREEQELLDWICKRSNKSGFIKDILFEVKAKEEKQKNKRVGFLTLN